MRIIIMGCGSVGCQLAEVLDTQDNTLAVIDSNSAALAALSSEFQGRPIVGSGLDELVLRRAGIEECDVFAAVTANDNANLMACEVARRLYGVPHVLIRLNNAERGGLYQQLGLDYICDTELVAENMAAKIRARRAHHLETLGEYEVLMFALNIESGVMQVRDLEAVGNIRVCLFEHDDEQFIPSAGMFLHDSDIVMVVAHEKALPRLEKYMKGDRSEVATALQAHLATPQTTAPLSRLTDNVAPGAFFASQEGR